MESPGAGSPAAAVGSAGLAGLAGLLASTGLAGSAAPVSLVGWGRVGTWLTLTRGYDSTATGLLAGLLDRRVDQLFRDLAYHRVVDVRAALQAYRPAHAVDAGAAPGHH